MAHLSIKTARTAFGALAAAVLLTAALPATAHIADNFNAVHFHSGWPDFGTVPRRAIIPWKNGNDDRDIQQDGMGEFEDRVYVELTSNDDAWRDHARAAGRRHLMDQAIAAVRAGRWRQALSLSRAGGDRFGWDNGARNQVYVLELALRQKDAPDLRDEVSQYIAALGEDDDGHGNRALESMSALESRSRQPWLKAHAAYQAAGIAYEDRDFPTALRGFRQVLEGWNNGPMREECLIMIARSALQSGRPGERRIGQAKEAIDLLQKDFPKTRFHGDIVGLRARIATLQGDYTSAIPIYFSRDDLSSVEWILKRRPKLDHGDIRPRLLAAYFRRIMQAKTYWGYANSVEAVDRVRQSFGTADSLAFARILQSQPETAVSYLYYRLYLSDDSDRDFRRLVDLADHTGDRWASASSKIDADLAALTCTRLAEVYYQDRKYARALHWTARSLVIRSSDRALFVDGACRLKQGRADEAAADFTRLLNAYSNSPLRRSAREELALADEKRGDLDQALDQYFALGYQTDIAFLLDVLLTTDQVIHYESAHPNAPAHKLLVYSAGMRCLRDERYHDANRWFAMLPRADYRKFSRDSFDWEGWGERVADPMTAAANLQQLKDDIARASRAQRPTAEYRYASYFYNGGTLLLYNSALWQGQRAMSFSYWWNPTVASIFDTARTRQHMYDHEVYARSLRLCLEIAHCYPHSEIAPAALYRAACSARKLAEFNDWWRGEAVRKHLWDQSEWMMRQVAARYPHSPLAPHARKYARVFLEEADTTGSYVVQRLQSREDTPVRWRRSDD